jgi:DNA-directed RNA polymerase subunit N (RpoN/RPB10)
MPLLGNYPTSNGAIVANMYEEYCRRLVPTGSTGSRHAYIDQLVHNADYCCFSLLLTYYWHRNQRHGAQDLGVTV